MRRNTVFSSNRRTHDVRYALDCTVLLQFDDRLKYVLPFLKISVCLHANYTGLK